MKSINKFYRLTKIAVLLITNPILLGYGKVSAQVPVINNGISVSVLSTMIFIDGDVYHQNNGSIVNFGNIHLTGDWLNNNPVNPVFTTGSDGWVQFVGDNQIIGGSTITHFNNLELSGTGTKQLNNVDAEIEDTLALNDRELSAESNTVFVMNTNTGVVTRTNTMAGGFVSSINDGGLSRNTASTNTYSFPVGSSAGIVRFRPVELTPNSTSANTFKVRMANVNPTIENYDISLKQDSLCEVNPDYYHRIYRTAGISSADIKIYYDAAVDGNYQSISHWQNVPQWENTGNNTFSAGAPLSSLAKNGWSDFSTNSFALAKLIPVASISTNAVCSGNDPVLSAPPGFANYEFFVNGISVQNGTSNTYSSLSLINGDSVKVILFDTVSCPGSSNNIPVIINQNPVLTVSNDDTISLGESTTISVSGANVYNWLPAGQNTPSITVGPTEETRYTVLGTDGNGCTDTATITIYVDATCVHRLPNTFSPNGDGQNETFKMLGKNLEWISLTVFDRWGNKVFETNDIAGKWDGTYNGNTMNSGVFVYIVKGKCKNSQEEFEQYGNVTLTR